MSDETEKTPTENGANGGRDPVSGRFLPGNRGGPGAPFLDRVSHFRRLLVAAVTDEDLEEIARALVRRAREADLAAVKILLPYLIGRPLELPDAEEDTGAKGQILLVLPKAQAETLDCEELARRNVRVIAVEYQDQKA